MDAPTEVVDAARRRAQALADADAGTLLSLLHEDFRWTAHTGDAFGRAEYVRRNTAGHTVWRSQDLGTPEVVVVGDTAVLTTVVTDVVSWPDGDESCQMPMTQVWVRERDTWLLLAGHAGPRRR